MASYFTVKLICTLLAFVNIQITVAQVTSTESPSEPTSILPSTSASNEVSSTEPNLKISSEKKQLLFPVYSFNLTDETIKLVISPSESVLEFRISIGKKLNSSTKSNNFTLKDAKRFMVAFENDHFNVDVVSIPFTKDSSGNVAFGNVITDFSWNKKNGIMLRDPIQNYVWVSSGAKENGSEFFVTFTRDWLTCDEQDIQFTFSDLKVWWLIDTQNSSLVPSSKKASHKMFEKQEATPEQTTVLPSTTEPTQVVDLSTQTTPTTTTQQSNNSTKETPTSSPPIDKVGSVKPSLLVPSSTVSSKEVEVLKSISDFKFQGPQDISFQTTLLTTSFVYLKTCDESLPFVFHCNATTLISGITNSSYFLHIWRIGSLNNSETPKANPEFQIQPCNKIVKLIKEHQSSNKPTSKAFSGNRTPKSHIPSKNTANNNVYAQSITYANMLTLVLFIKTIISGVY